jgi:hypothetical protein
MTAYMALAVLFEERDLSAHFGQQYEDYRRRVPKFVPRLSRAATNLPGPDGSRPGLRNGDGHRLGAMASGREATAEGDQ